MAPLGRGPPRTLARTAAAGPAAFVVVPQETAVADTGPVVEQARQSDGSGVPTPTNGVDVVVATVVLGCFSPSNLAVPVAGCSMAVSRCILQGRSCGWAGLPFALHVGAVPTG